ncbi:RAD52 family DNA repair protein [Cyanobium sp. Aljojuca 7D2]|uniref:RAD52 family DNA repair protein n=1 Tax=Cyanobium sp. Aljojuca 7D2 TaxID=2823698 RepID=UPI0020CE8964|nr:RAD52 family DNA repair protein [Cyanobium sp. Aljojuca 7D2]MCP9890992.1 RAD52 family DNA repair protein [Cyanobium sp. Aljojuca 7D2]
MEQSPQQRSKVQTRSQAGRSLSYMEGWQAIAEANRIFGFDGWQRETIAVTCVAERERTLGSSNRAGWGVTYTARVRIRVGEVIREGSGAGHGIDADLGQAHESAIKEAETDAMKRALMTFGNPFGLALYDKQQREVTSSAASMRQAQPLRQQQESAGPEPGVEMGLEPLDPATIQTILSTVRGLPKPALEGFTKAFRKRFQVPADAPSIADRICQRLHRDWIEAFLVSHREVRSGDQRQAAA